MSIRIILVDDHRIFREGMRAGLEDHGDLEVVGEAENGRTAVKLAQELKPDVVVMDLSMPELNGIEATRQILASEPKAKVIILSMHSDQESVSRVLRAGARGFLAKESAMEELVTAIYEVVRKNRTFLSPDIAEIVYQDYARGIQSDPPQGPPELTQREHEVLQLVVEGNATKQVAKMLHVSIKTIETHRKRIMDKLDIHDIPGLTKYAIRNGITSL